MGKGAVWVVKLEGSGREKKRKWKDEDRRIRGLRALRNLEHCLRYVPSVLGIITYKYILVHLGNLFNLFNYIL